MRSYQAANELKRVSSLSAFNVLGATSRRKVNQFLTVYTFADRSTMCIYAGRSVGCATHPDWNGTAEDVHLGHIQNLPLAINR